MVVPNTIENPSSEGNGTGSVVDATGTTSDSFVEVFSQSSSEGIFGIGSIVNDGANDMDVRETVTDKFGNTVSVVTTVVAGDEYLLDLQTNFDDGGGNLALPPFTDYSVEVQSTVAGNATTYELHFISMGPGTGGGGGGTTPEAATFVVSPTPGVGDFTTIAAALAALPAEGGYLLLREGTYSLSAANVLPDKDVVLRGCGPGATVIDLGSNAISGFEIGFSRNYKFEDLSIIGDGATANQVGIDGTAPVTGNLTLLNVLLQNLDVALSDENEGIRIEIIGSTLNGNVAIQSGSSSGGKVSIIDSTISTLATDAITPGLATPPTIYASTGTSIVGAVSVSSGEFSGCVIQGAMTLDNSTGTANVGVTMSGCRIIGQIIMPSGATGHKIANCRLETASGDDALDMRGANCDVTSCRWDNPGGGAVFVTEASPAQDNRYENCEDFTDSVLRTTAVVNGAKRSSHTSGGSGDAYSTIVDHKNPKGLLGVGTIVNTDGADSLTVKETATDAFGTTASVETVVAPGDDYMLDPQTNFDDGMGNIAYPPHLEYKVEVKSTSAGNSASYLLHFASQGAI